MKTYLLKDANNQLIGSISLDNDEIPAMIMRDEEMTLGGLWDEVKGEFKTFIVIPEPHRSADHLSDVRRSAVALSGLTDNIYLGDCVREWTKALREEQKLGRQQMRESLEHSKEALAFQKSVFEET